MYHYLDRSVSSLDLGGRFIVWAARGWVQAVSRRQCPCHALGDGFTRWNATAALQSFSMAMAILNCEAGEPLYFRAPGHSRVSDDEALLLDLFEQAPRRPQNEMREMLGMIVPPTSAPSLQIAIETAAAALEAIGLGPSAQTGN
ncbi:hypothetical protein [Sphingomonas sp. MS122]|uniref:hypothetical protein n=1 Tax=Sphingomonas sp. MS122 TaxID=3412683 RepID=UPI003C2FF3EE